MSGRADIRMYVEHLFEGRTLDAETIELKEEIYGNLVARYDDYVAQGMSADEAYRRTCEAVTSVDDVMGAGRGAGGAADEATRAMPRPAEAGAAAGQGPLPPHGAPPAPSAAPGAPAAPRRWGVGAIVGVVAVAVVAVVGIFIVLNVLDESDAGERYASQTSQTVQQVDDAPTTGGGQATGTTTQVSDDLSEQINAVSPETLAAQTSLSVASPEIGDVNSVEHDSLTQLVAGLPLGAYFAGTGTREGSDTLQLTYNYQNDDERDRIARDDDYVDRALVFNAAALMCTIGDLNTLSIEEVELDDGDWDGHVFERAAMEDALGVRLDASQLTSDAWPALRETLMDRSVWNRIWERADLD